MSVLADTARPDTAAPKSVQDYIDERPVWPDGTTLKSSPMTAMQWRIWSLAAAGKFFEGFVVFMTGVALPLIVREFHIGAAEKGIVSAASLFGILIGAVLLGGLSDYLRPQAHVHRRDDHLLRLPGAADSVPEFSLARDLPVRPRHGAWLRLSDRAHDHFGEHPQPWPRQTGARRLCLPGRRRAGRHRRRAASSWYSTPNSAPGAGCSPPRSSPRSWSPSAVSSSSKARTGCPREAQHEKAEIRRHASCCSARRNIRSDITPARGTPPTPARPKPSFWSLFNSRNRRATIFASVPWFIQDLGTYGIGIFTPTILAAALGGGADHIRSVSDLISDDILAAKGVGDDHRPADRRHRLRRGAGRQAGPHQAADRRLHRLRRSACCWPRSRSTSKAARRSR